MKIEHLPYNLRFKYPFTISRGTKTHQPTFIVSLEQFGRQGYGEAPAITYYHIPVEKMAADLEIKKPMIEKFCFYGTGSVSGIFCIISFRTIHSSFAHWILPPGIFMENCRKNPCIMLETGYRRRHPSDRLYHRH